MKALVWHGRYNMQCDTVPDPVIEEDNDIIIKVTRTAICGSDLHLFDSYAPMMEKGDILGHEFMGEVVETAKGTTKHKIGDKVVVPFVMSCGHCWFCDQQLTSLCDNSNPDPEKAAAIMGHSPAGLYGYTHMLGGFAGGQAEYVRVRYADHGPTKVPDGIDDEKVLFLTDIFPTGWMAALNCEIKPGDTVAIWGCGPVGQMTIQSAWLQGAGRVIAIDHVPERLAMAKTLGKAETINFMDESVYERLQEMTKGRGPDSVVDAVGAEAHGLGSVDAVVDRAKAAVGLATDRPHVWREMIKCVRKGGHVSVPGVYFGYADKIPLGTIVNKGLTIKSGQTNVQKYMDELMQMVLENKIDPSFVITHRVGLEDGPEMYQTFKDKKDGCIKVVMNPAMKKAA
jgi:threonine dehydrogenase-like Zn-dependent dehydrogenase